MGIIWSPRRQSFWGQRGQGPKGKIVGRMESLWKCALIQSWLKTSTPQSNRKSKHFWTSFHKCNPSSRTKASRMRSIWERSSFQKKSILISSVLIWILNCWSRRKSKIRLWAKTKLWRILRVLLFVPSITFNSCGTRIAIYSK